MARRNLAACDLDGDAFAIGDFPRELQIRRRAYGDNLRGDTAPLRTTELFEKPVFRFRKRGNGAARVDGQPRRY